MQHPSEVPQPADIRRAAIELLARREHSTRELRQKLLRRFHCDTEIINKELARLVSENFQSDTRFTEAFVNSRIRKGYGPQRLQMELRDRGIAPELAEEFIPDDNEFWLELARDVRVKRFGEDLPDFKDKSRQKQMRFLQYRGFPSDIIRTLFR